MAALAGADRLLRVDSSYLCVVWYTAWRECLITLALPDSRASAGTREGYPRGYLGRSVREWSSNLDSDLRLQKPY